MREADAFAVPYLCLAVVTKFVFIMLPDETDPLGLTHAREIKKKTKQNYIFPCKQEITSASRTFLCLSRFDLTLVVCYDANKYDERLRFILRNMKNEYVHSVCNRFLIVSYRITQFLSNQWNCINQIF